jgi:hypothetical protein
MPWVSLRTAVYLKEVVVPDSHHFFPSEWQSVKLNVIITADKDTY